MKKLVIENLEEFRNIQNNTEENVDEGIKEFFSSVKNNINNFLKDPKDENKANSLISSAFIRQFNNNPKIKEFILKQPLEKKVEILRQCSKKLEDKTIGVLKLFKNTQGKLAVGGVALAGGASKVVHG